MALQKRVSELPAVTTVAGTDLLIVSSNNATKRTSVQQIGAYFAANGVAGPQGPQGPAGAAGATDYTQLTNVPATFPPSAHGHTIAEVTGLSAALDGKQAVGSYATLVGGKVPESQLPPIVTTWEGLTGKPSTFPPAVHGHAIADVTGLQTALDGKQIAGSYAAAVHTHGISDVTGLQTALDGKAASSHTHTIANVTGLQSALDAKATPADVTSAVASVVNAAPASLDTLKELADALGNDANFASTVTNAIAGKAAAVHTHVIADVTGLQTALDGKQASGSYAAATHGHSISDVTGLQTALDGKQAAGSYAAAVHTHGISDVTGLQTALDGKAAASHGHAIADVTGLQTALDGKQASGSYAAATHSHAIADVTGLQTALDGKAAQSHTHSAVDITDFATAVAAASPEEVLEYAATGDFPATGNTSSIYIATDASRAYRWTGSQYVEVGPSSSFVAAHTHAASEITSGVLATARLGSGTADATTYLRGDQTYATPTAAQVGAAATAAVYEFTRTSKPVDATGATPGPYTWSLPTGARVIEVAVISGGGGGGSGRRGAAGTARFGGGGGGGAGGMIAVIDAAAITTPLTIAVGAGGAGGAAVTVDNTNGNSGSSGGLSSVAFNGSTWFQPPQGYAASGGSDTAGAPGAADSVQATTFRGISGGAASGSGTGGSGFAAAGFAGAGGAAGGTINGGASNILSPGTQRTSAGLAPYFLQWPMGSASVSAGAASTTSPATDGPNGSTYGAGGNGGGASANGFDSGAGGNGGSGYVRITVWF